MDILAHMGIPWPWGMGMDMVSDKCRTETMAITIINLIVAMTNTANEGNIVNVNMAEKVEAMASIEGMIMIDQPSRFLIFFNW
ncbi:MAG TPA: hypothetical protein VIE65_03310 [Methylobacter sp.]